METKEKKQRVSHRGDAEIVNRKMRLFYLIDYMREYSDESHPVKIKEIADHLTGKDIYTTRKALYDDFEVLREYGIEIVRKPGTYAYYFASPQFTLSELKLLTDIIYVSGFITEEKTLDLTQRLGKMCSRYQRTQLSRQMLTVAAKSKNEQVLDNVSAICEAIARDSEISFLYVDYATPDGKTHYRRNGERYIRSPYHLIYDNGQYYLLSYNSDERMREHLRVDRMEDIQIVEGQHRKGIGTINREAAHDFTKYTFSMFSDGEAPRRVTMRFNNILRGVVYDRFGDVMFSEDKDGRHFEITTDIAVSRQFFGWILGLGKYAAIVWPKSVRNEMRQYLKDIAAMYNDD